MMYDSSRSRKQTSNLSRYKNLSESERRQLIRFDTVRNRTDYTIRKCIASFSYIFILDVGVKTVISATMGFIAGLILYLVQVKFYIFWGIITFFFNCFSFIISNIFSYS